MKLVFATACFVACAYLGGAKYEADWKSLDSRPLPNWFDQGKIGIFLHWGLFAVPGFGSEWMWAYWKGKQKDIVDFMSNNFKPSFTYQDFGPMFTTEFFDPNQWTDIFQASGAKYVVLTSKHHEGYTMWPSKYSWNWNSQDTGPKRDLIGDLATSIRNRTSLRFGLYHSLYEWYHPLYLLDKKNNFTTKIFVETKMIPEMVELVNSYKPEVIWSDGDWEAKDAYFNSTDFLAWLYNDSPVKETVVVNDRWGIGIPCNHGGYYTCTDRFNPGVLQHHKWENAMTLDLGSWGYRRNAQLESIMTIEQLVEILAQTVSCGGNILINVGPTPDGRIIPIFEERLRQLGSWLKINGEAIYQSTPWINQNDTVTKGIWYTQRLDLDSIYATVLHWPKSNVLNMGSIDLDPGSKVTMLGVEGALSWKSSSGPKNLVVDFPVLTPDIDPSKWGWVLKFQKPEYDVKSNRV